MKFGRISKVFSFITGLLMFSVIFVPISMSQNPVIEVNGTPAGWSDDINLSNNSTAWDQYPSICTWDDTIHVIYRHHYEDFVYTKSTDGGNTWSPSISLYNNGLGSLFYSDIAVSNQDVHVVMDDHDGWDGVYYRNSTDIGDTWNPVKRISADGANAGNSHIYVNNSNIHILWHNDSAGPSGQVFYRRSLDGGITWDNGQGVNQDRQVSFSPADIGGLNMAGEGSNISAIWYDERDGDWEIYWMISKDNGFTWEDGLGTTNVGRKLTDSSDDSTDPAVCINGSKIHVIWVNQVWPGPNYYLYYRNSTDNGVTWNPIQLLTGPSPLIASPDIAVCGNTVHVTWDDARDDGSTMEIYYKNSTDNGISWGGDTRLTYNEGNHSYHPRIAPTESMVHVTWWDARLGNAEIYYKRYPDFPDTSPPDHTNETPSPDSYKDAPGTNVSVHVTDPSGVNESTIQLYINGSLVAHTSTQITDGYNVSWVSGGFDPGIVECRIVVDDNLSNTLDFTWNFTVLALYEIQLHEGWNLISVPYVQVDISMNEVLRDIDGKWDYILWYDASDSDDHWKTNATFKPQQLNDLIYLDRGMAFWINITESDVNLTVRGIIPESTEIQLYAGWNLVGYPTQTTETVANALWGTGADKVEVFNASAPYNIQAVDASYVMKPGEGYWIHVPVDSIWIIDW